MIQQGNNELEVEKNKAVEDYSKLMETNPNAAKSNIYAAIERLNKKKKNLVYLVGKAKENEDKFNEQDKSLMGKELYPSQLVDINMKRGDYGRAAELFKDKPIEEWEKHMYEIPDYQPGNIGKKYDVVKDALAFMKDVKPVAISSELKHAGSDSSGDWYQYGSGNEVTRDKVAAAANLYFDGNEDAQRQFMNDYLAETATYGTKPADYAYEYEISPESKNFDREEKDKEGNIHRYKTDVGFKGYTMKRIDKITGAGKEAYSTSSWTPVYKHVTDPTKSAQAYKKVMKKGVVPNTIDTRPGSPIDLTNINTSDLSKQDKLQYSIQMNPPDARGIRLTNDQMSKAVADLMGIQNDLIQTSGTKYIETKNKGITFPPWRRYYNILSIYNPSEIKEIIDVYNKTRSNFLPEMTVDDYNKNIKPFAVQENKDLSSKVVDYNNTYTKNADTKDWTRQDFINASKSYSMIVPQRHNFADYQAKGLMNDVTGYSLTTPIYLYDPVGKNYNIVNDVDKKQKILQNLSANFKRSDINDKDKTKIYPSGWESNVGQGSGIPISTSAVNIFNDANGNTYALPSTSGINEEYRNVISARQTQNYAVQYNRETQGEVLAFRNTKTSIEKKNLLSSYIGVDPNTVGFYQYISNPDFAQIGDEKKAVPKTYVILYDIYGKEIVSKDKRPLLIKQDIDVLENEASSNISNNPDLSNFMNQGTPLGDNEVTDYNYYYNNNNNNDEQ